LGHPVKRPYNSTLRDEQARATRRAIVQAAAELFVERGYGATTIDAIAVKAGVGRKTVFTSVGSKAQALKLAIDWAIVGDDEPVPVADRPQTRAAMAEPDARRILTTIAPTLLSISSRIAPLVAAAEAVAGTDREIKELTDEIRRQRRTGMGSLAALLADRGALRPDMTVDEAADVMTVLVDPNTYLRLVVERHWDLERAQQWLSDALVRILLVDQVGQDCDEPA
jgi:AcrR family transcriptional regulator